MRSSGVASRFQNRASPRPMTGSVATATKTAERLPSGLVPPSAPFGSAPARSIWTDAPNHGRTSRSHAAS